MAIEMHVFEAGEAWLVFGAEMLTDVNTDTFQDVLGWFQDFGPQGAGWFLQKHEAVTDLPFIKSKFEFVLFDESVKMMFKLRWQ